MKELAAFMKKYKHMNDTQIKGLLYKYDTNGIKDL